MLRYFSKEATGKDGLPFANIVPPSSASALILGQLICCFYYVFCPLAFASMLIVKLDILNTRSFYRPRRQCRINHGANGSAAPGAPTLRDPHIKFLNVGLFGSHCTYCSESNLEIMIFKVHIKVLFKLLHLNYIFMFNFY